MKLKSLLLLIAVAIAIIGGSFISKYKESSTETESKTAPISNNQVNLPSSGLPENDNQETAKQPTIKIQNKTTIQPTDTQTPSITTTTTSTSKKTTISMTDNSFSPSSISINKGDIIVFINNGSNAHWPASNTHPTHEIYPEFDPRRPISPGSLWEFKFEKSGSWKMHDHLSPKITGTITVN
ncbi:MAG: hypothetical protein EXS49_00370 [Candidatus Pacebacteria bacterium]|nr:hypothetical protein [Candidatus Paceibacterota bacterium]